LFSDVSDLDPVTAVAQSDPAVIYPAIRKLASTEYAKRHLFVKAFDIAQDEDPPWKSKKLSAKIASI
jgi:hypothetical protein